MKDSEPRENVDGSSSNQASASEGAKPDDKADFPQDDPMEEGSPAKQNQEISREPMDVEPNIQTGIPTDKQEGEGSSGSSSSNNNSAQQGSPVTPPVSAPEDAAPKAPPASPIVASKDITKRPPQVEDLKDAFEGFAPKSRQAKRNRRVPNINIQMKKPSVNSSSAGETVKAAEEKSIDEFAFRSEIVPETASRSSADGVVHSDTDVEIDREVEQALSFFEDTHEDQDPSYQEFQRDRTEAARQKQLKDIEAEDRNGQKGIVNLLNAMMKEKHTAAQRNYDKTKVRYAEEEKREIHRLTEMYRQKSEGSAAKVKVVVQNMQRRHHQEQQTAMQHHQQFSRQQRIPDHIANSEWQKKLQQIQLKQQSQRQEIGAKSESMKKKLEEDFQAGQQKIRKGYEQKKQDIHGSLDRMLTRLRSQFQHLRTRHVKRHMHKMLKKKEKLQQLSSTEVVEKETSTPEVKSSYSASELAKSTLQQEKIELRQPSPIKSILEWAEESQHALSGGSSRHKNRKGVMSQSPRHLSVEIHNEGVWVFAYADKSSGRNDDPSDQNTPVDQEFIVWGNRAHSVIESIVCGEIPHGFERFGFGETAVAQGWQLRCAVSDMRVSEDAASAQRALAVREHEDTSMQSLEKKAAAISTKVDEDEKAVNRCVAEEKDCASALEVASKKHQEAKRVQQEFRTKFQRYLDPDGKPLPTTRPNEQQQLLKAINRYKSNIEAAQTSERMARKSLEDTRARLQKLQSNFKNGQKNSSVVANIVKKKKMMLAINRSTGGRNPRLSDVAEQEKAASRVKDVKNALKIVAEKRRQKTIQLKSKNVTSSWMKLLEGVPNVVKKSLLHKMHRRKHQVVLRPLPEVMLNEIRSIIEAGSDGSGKRGRSQKDQAKLENDWLRAEQLFLLAMHPVSDEDVPSVPPTKSTDSWAEPGWQLLLDVPRSGSDSLLPCAPTYQTVEKNLSEILSAPGRQAASLIQSSFLRGMGMPKSSGGVASSPAQPDTDTMVEAESNEVIDPFQLSEEGMEAGYSFHAKPSSKGGLHGRRKTPEASLAAAGTGGKKAQSTLDGRGDKRKSVTKQSTEARKRTKTEPAQPDTNLHANPSQDIQQPSVPNPISQYNQFVASQSTAASVPPKMQLPPTSVQPQMIQTPPQTRPQQLMHASQQAGQYSSPQMMQQQRRAQQRHPSVNANYSQPMQQFYNPLTRPNAPTQFQPNMPSMQMRPQMAMAQGRSTSQTQLSQGSQPQPQQPPQQQQPPPQQQPQQQPKQS